MNNEPQERAARSWLIIYGAATIIVLALSSLRTCSLPAHAQDSGVSAPETTPVTSTTLASAGSSDVAGDVGLAELMAARACYVEATWSEADCAALLWVVRKRAERSGRTFVDTLLAYSALKSDSRRVREVRSWTADDVPGQSASWNRRWAKLRTLAADVLAGRVQDPCSARTVHWGGMSLRGDHERAQRALRAGKWVLARCSQRTSNTFFEERR